MKWGHKLLFALIAGVFNFLLSTLIHFMGLPLYFDSIFTMLTTITAGLIPGLITALLTNTLLALADQVLFPFVLCHISTVLIAYVLIKKKRLAGLRNYLWLGIAAGIANGLLGSVISLFIFEGVTEVHSIDTLVIGLLMTGQTMMMAIFSAGMLTNLIDKVLSATASFFLQNYTSRLIDKPLFSRKVEE